MRDGQGNYSLSRRMAQSDAVELQSMTVEGFALGNALGSMEGYNATHSSVATKTSMPLVETSQTVSVVTRQQIEDQGSRSIAQAVRYTPGLMSTPYGATTRYDYVAMRGITDGSVDNLYLDGQKLLGDSGTYSSLQVDPYFIERIDILKGPSSVLYGRSLPGGLVAMTSKKPQKEASRQLQFSYGSHDYKQAAFDFTGPLDDERIAYRLVGVAKDADNQVDGIEEQRYAVMPSVSIDFTEDTRLTLLAMLQRDPESGYHGGLPADGTVTSHNGQRISRSFFEGDRDYEKFERDQQMIGYQLEHRFNDVVSARQNFQYLTPPWTRGRCTSTAMWPRVPMSWCATTPGRRSAARLDHRQPAAVSLRYRRTQPHPGHRPRLPAAQGEGQLRRGRRFAIDQSLHGCR